MSAKRDVTDFLPDALAIQQAVLPWRLRHAIAILGALFACLLLLFFFMKVDVIVSAQGKLVSDHPTVMLKPLERTVIKEICVKIGDTVRENQVLATFDPVFSIAERDRLKAEEKRLQAQYERMAAELKDQDYPQPANADPEQALQRKIYADRRELYQNRTVQYANEITSMRQSMDSLRENIGLQEKRLAKFREIETMLARAGKAVSARDLKDAQIARMQLEADISDKQHEIEVTESRLRAKENESLAFISDWKVELAENYAKTASELTHTKKELAKAAQMADYVELRAPENAVIHDIAPISRGSAIREAETLFTLVPTRGKLEAEVEIKAEDIGKVKPGDTAKIKISAFPFQKYGTLPGIVRVISEDSFVRSQENPSAVNAGAYYKAYVQLTPHDAKNEWLAGRLIPGMEAQADILTGERSILEYLVHPIIKSLDEAIREP